MKLITILVGCGDRTCVYADLAMHTFDAIEVVAAVDPDKERQKSLPFPFSGYAPCIHLLILKSLRSPYIH